MSRENYDNYDQEDFTYQAADHVAGDSINSETMEKKDPAINQHQNESDRHSHIPHHDEDSISEHSDEKENDTSDPFFQKNASIAQDLDEDLKDEDDDDDFDNDANRRTLDETKPDEDEDDDY
ncbi:hypothetical protein J0383_00280 [Flavobacterium endoglycinae]|uniref:DNA primase n=1 Tax=Flavobacterium endoglycinae TaxID=2816357 RepID=A0ABX7QDZ0_9FLAO|nr:hypothetical protein [Flavobacterium endoglycinae]QSW89267.1 hypothetical protein J0383_00280 [Flavobacterium endoglycinae]